jgi:hypothetical protein
MSSLFAYFFRIVFFDLDAVCNYVRDLVRSIPPHQRLAAVNDALDVAEYMYLYILTEHLDICVFVLICTGVVGLGVTVGTGVGLYKLKGLISKKEKSVTLDDNFN